MAYLKDDQWIELDGASQVLAVTLNGETIDDVLSTTVSNTALDPIKDHLGSIYGWTNANTGVVVQKQSYSAYGETTIEQSSPLLEQLGSLRGYTSRELDQATGLYFYRARWYDSKLGRFISADPAKFNGGDYSWYRYVGNRPVVYVDPSGKWPEWLDDGLCSLSGRCDPADPDSDDWSDTLKDWFSDEMDDMFGGNDEPQGNFGGFQGCKG